LNEWICLLLVLMKMWYSGAKLLLLNIFVYLGKAIYEKLLRMSQFILRNIYIFGSWYSFGIFTKIIIEEYPFLKKG